MPPDTEAGKRLSPDSDGNCPPDAQQKKAPGLQDAEVASK
jgi:hypothetical protein